MLTFPAHLTKKISHTKLSPARAFPEPLSPSIYRYLLFLDILGKVVKKKI